MTEESQGQKDGGLKKTGPGRPTRQIPLTSESVDGVKKSGKTNKRTRPVEPSIKSGKTNKKTRPEEPSSKSDKTNKKTSADEPVASDPVSEPMESGETNEKPPPDWLEPLEDDCEQEGDEGIQNGRRRRRGRPVDLEKNWFDCPGLGRGWKRKEVFRRSGSTVGKTDIYYMSPKGQRFRSKLELSKHIAVDLTCFDFKQGMFVDGVIKTKRQKADTTDEGTRGSSYSSSRAATPDLNVTRTQENITETPQRETIQENITATLQCETHSQVSTPQASQLTPNATAADVGTTSSANEGFGSPPQLTRVSPLVLQITAVKQPSPSTSLKLDDFSLGLDVAPDKEDVMPSNSWLQSSLPPVSPPKTPERDPAAFMNKGSPEFSLPPPTRLVLDPEKTLGGGKQCEVLPPVSGCSNCGSQYPDMDDGQEECPKCTSEKKRPSPHIVFRKVGQDKWVLGKAKTKRSLKNKMSPLRKKRPVYRSHRLMAKQEEEKIKTFKPQEVKQDSDDGDEVGGDEDFKPDAGDDDDEEQESRRRSRNRRMCGRCKACLRNEDCGTCDFCMDKPKFGGDNKKRQKCRFRQCQVQSRLQLVPRKYVRRRALLEAAANESTKLRRRGRPPGKRKVLDEGELSHKDDQDHKEDEERRPTRIVRRRKVGKSWRYILEEYEHQDEEMEKPAIEDGGPGDLEQGLISPTVLPQSQFMVYDDVCESKELYPNNYSLGAQNGTMGVVGSSGHHPNMVQPVQQIVPQDVLCTLAGLPEGSRVLGSIKLGNSAPLQLTDLLDKAAPPQLPDILSNNVHFSEMLRKTGLEVIRVDTALPQLVPDLNRVHEQKPAPEPPHPTPTITEVYSLADGTESESAQDSGLLELLSSLRRTVLPPHWVGVMARGPLLQLFQCSKLSPMADTVLQIETGFFYQISVQNQPLLLTHSIYERHPVRLTSVERVVALLLDLEGLSVCQGYQSFEVGPRHAPLLCARAALCQLLVTEEEESCEKCQLPAEA